MRKVSIYKIKTGMKLAKPVISPEGRILLSEGVILKDNYISRLRDLGIFEVYIQDEISKDIHI